MFGANPGPGVGGNIMGMPIGYGMMTGPKANAPTPRFGLSPQASGHTPQAGQQAGGQAGGGKAQQIAGMAKKAKKALDLGQKAGDLFGPDDITYGSGLSFSPEQIASFQEGGLTPQAASGPEGLGGGFSPGMASGMAGVGSAVSHYLQTGDIVESTGKGGLVGGGSLAATAALGPWGLVAAPLINFGLGSLMGDKDEPHVSVDIGTNPAYKRAHEEKVPTGYQEHLETGLQIPTAFKTQDRYIGYSDEGGWPGNVFYPHYSQLSDPKNIADPEQVKAWGEALGVPVETNRWQTQEPQYVGKDKVYVGDKTVDHTAAYFTEDPGDLSLDEYNRIRQDLIGQGKLPGQIVESPSGSQVIVDNSPYEQGIGDQLYQSTKYPSINVWTDDIDYDNTQLGLGTVSILEGFADQLKTQGKDPNEVFSSQFWKRYNIEDDLGQDIAATVGKHYGLQPGPGVGGKQQSTGLSVGKVASTGQIIG